MEPNLQKGMQVMNSLIGRCGSFKSPGIVRLLCQPKFESDTASDGNLPESTGLISFSHFCT